MIEVTKRRNNPSRSLLSRRTMLRRVMSWTGTVALSLAFATSIVSAIGCAASASARVPAPAEASRDASPWSARHLAVHVDPIDTTDPHAGESFAASIATHDGWLAAEHVSQPPKRPWQADDGVWWTMRPYTDWENLRAHQSAQNEVDAALRSKVGAAAFDANEDRAHQTLRGGHRNELWTRDDDDSYIPTSSGGVPSLDLHSAPFARATFLSIRPSREDALDRALLAAKARLAAAHDPHPLLVFSSTYGSGDIIVLQLAESRAVAAAMTAPPELPADATTTHVLWSARQDLTN